MDAIASRKIRSEGGDKDDNRVVAEERAVTTSPELDEICKLALQTQASAQTITKENHLFIPENT